MKTPDCVIWGLTKKNNAYLKKFNHNQWTHNPLSKTGFHNASSASSNCSIQGEKVVKVDKAAKKDDDKKKSQKSKKVFEVVVKHRMRHGRKVRKAGSQSGVLVSSHKITKDVHRTSKIVQGLTFVSDHHKKQLLRRLVRTAA